MFTPTTLEGLSSQCHVISPISSSSDSRWKVDWVADKVILHSQQLSLMSQSPVGERNQIRSAWRKYECSQLEGGMAQIDPLTSIMKAELGNQPVDLNSWSNISANYFVATILWTRIQRIPRPVFTSVQGRRLETTFKERTESQTFNPAFQGSSNKCRRLRRSTYVSRWFIGTGRFSTLMTNLHF